MSIPGILENLIAMAIWTCLAAIVVKVRKRFLKEDKNQRDLVAGFKRVISESNDMDLKQDLYMAISIVLDGYQRELNTLVEGRTWSIILFLVFFFNAAHYSKPSGYEGSIIFFFYLLLIAFESYQIKRIKNRLYEVERIVAEGISLRRKSVLKESSKD